MKAPLTNSRVNWIYDPYSNQLHHVEPRQTAPKINTNTAPRKNHNTVAKNNNVIQNSQSHAQSSLETIPSASSPRRNVPKHSQAMPRSNIQENKNSPFQIGRESSRNLGLYKPTPPDPNQDTWAYNFAANSSEVGPPSPTRTFAANSSGSGNRTGIIYPLQPRGRRPDVCIEVEASLPEPAAFLRPDLRQPESYAAAGSSCKPSTNLQAT